MQKKWETILADQFEGGVSEEKAMLDIKRGMLENLYHEAIGISQSATPKHVSGIDLYTGTGIIAFDRVKYLPWKDYKKIAKGEDVIVPHVGNVDTIQIPIDQIWYFSTQFMSTDLVRLKQSGLYRAKITANQTRSLAVTLDCEFIDLLIAAAAGQKGGIIQTDFPKSSYRIPYTEFNYYKLYSEIGNELETTITPYNLGANRGELVCIVDPSLYSELISHFKGQSILIEKVLEYIQNEQIVPAKISNVRLIRYPFLNKLITPQVSNDFRSYDFRGVRMIYYLTAAPFIVPVYGEQNGVIDKDTGNYRMISRVMYAKGIVYGNMIRVVTEKSTKTNPLAFETKFIENRDEYNSSYGFKDNDIIIPETITELQANYRQLEETEGSPEGKKPLHVPEWRFNYLRNKTDTVKVDDDWNIIFNGNKYYYSTEEWANEEGGMARFENGADYWNWFEFKKAHIHGNELTNFVFKFKNAISKF